MINKKSDVFLALILSLFVLVACSKKPEKSVPKADFSKSPYFPLYQEITNLLDSKSINTYRFSENDESEKKEKSFIKIDSLKEKNGFRHLEIYNTYVSESKETEYYVSEFRIDLKDTANKQKVLDYQLIEKNDSLLIGPGSEHEFKIVGSESIEIKEESIDLFLMSVYAHPADLAPDQYKVWSPSIGIILIWFGEDRWFELEKASGLDKKDLETVKEKSRKLVEGRG